nr:MAG TPA: hypothetical protein [Caudoviricetes sp.]
MCLIMVGGRCRTGGKRYPLLPTPLKKTPPAPSQAGGLLAIS